MAHGLRGRFAVLAAGMLFCTGLVGCMDNEPKPSKGPNKVTTAPGFPVNGAKAGGAPSPYGGGAQATGYNMPGARTPQADYNRTGAIGGNTNFGTPNVPGPTGAGMPMGPTSNSVIPPTTPVGSTSYNTGAALPSDSYGSSRAPVAGSAPDGFGPLPPAAPGPAGAANAGYAPLQYKN